MKAIKVNYNNAAVKKPKDLFPSFTCYRYQELDKGTPVKKIRITIDSKIDTEPIFNYYQFNVYANDRFLGTITPGSSQVIEVKDIAELSYEYFEIGIEGFYQTFFGTKYPFVKRTVKVYNYPVVSEELVCSESIYCSDYIYGYLVDGVFYTNRIETNGEYVYSEPIDPTLFTGSYIDIVTKYVYKWDSVGSTFVVI